MARTLKESVLETPIVYRMWQAPWVRAKLKPVLAHNSLDSTLRVLDLGCGPGTNAPFFSECEYLGIDINERYIVDAQRRFEGQFRGRFVAADVRGFSVPDDERFDFILLNSFLHHIDDAGTRGILESANRLLSDGGHVHILDLVLPSTAGPARYLARRDRGDFARPLKKWNEIFSATFEPVVSEPFPLRAFGLTLWNMIYFKGRARS